MTYSSVDTTANIQHQTGMQIHAIILSISFADDFLRPFKLAIVRRSRLSAASFSESKSMLIWVFTFHASSFHLRIDNLDLKRGIREFEAGLLAEVLE